jgi:hypothetical protein
LPIDNNVGFPLNSFRRQDGLKLDREKVDKTIDEISSMSSSCNNSVSNPHTNTKGNIIVNSPSEQSLESSSLSKKTGRLRRKDKSAKNNTALMLRNKQMIHDVSKVVKDHRN